MTKLPLPAWSRGGISSVRAMLLVLGSVGGGRSGNFDFREVALALIKQPSACSYSTQPRQSFIEI